MQTNKDLRIVPPECKAGMTQTCWWISCCCSFSDAFRPLLPHPGGHGIYTITISGWVFNKRLSLTSCCQKLKSKQFNCATCSSLAKLQPEARPRLRKVPHSVPWLVVIHHLCIWCLSCLMKLDQPWGLFTFAAQPNLTGLPAALLRLNWMRPLSISLYFFPPKGDAVNDSQTNMYLYTILWQNRQSCGIWKKKIYIFLKLYFAAIRLANGPQTAWSASSNTMFSESYRDVC